MSDFLKWLYAHYIRPQLDDAPREDYEMWISLLDDELTPDLREAYRKNREFTAIHAFLLGLRTGRGLPRQDKSLYSVNCSMGLAASAPPGMG